MATITTNFGWDIPQSTDLVKDGATAIATLGQDIDTFMKTGKVLQVVSATKTDSFSTTSLSYVDVTGVTLSITPTLATSKILVRVAGVCGQSSASEIVKFNLVRGATNIGQSTGSGSTNQTISIFPNNTTAGLGFAFEFLDSPATTSATTYKLQASGATGGTIFVGRYAANDNFRSITSITAMEISA